MDPNAAAWVVGQVVRGRRVVRAQRLTGGITSEVTGVAIEDAAGRTHRLVLRRWHGQPRPDGTVEDGRVLVSREAATLSLLEATAMPAPRVVAIDPTGGEAGLPALLMTRRPGRIDLTPADADRWTVSLAEQLARIHAMDAPAGGPPYECWLRFDDAGQLDSARTDAAGPLERWQEAGEVLATAPTATTQTFVHHDYQHFNVLWSRTGAMSGVVDWVGAGSGPADGDVVHCRTNLCLLYGAPRAIAFQDAYERIAGRRVAPWWDVAGVVDSLGWPAAEMQQQAGRRLRVDGAAFRARADALLGWVLRRVR
jgi:aminoglycoside phosphotransferase (APT) family kinase protein